MTAGTLPPLARARRTPLVSRGFLLTALLFLALNFQTLTFTGQLAEGESGTGPALKMYHGLFALLGIVVLARGRIVRWRQETIAYFTVVGLTSLVAYFEFGPKASIVNLLFAAYAATLGGTVGALAGREAAVRALRATSLAVLAIVLVKAVVNLPIILAFLAAPNGHPKLPSLYGGGANLEATWVAMAGVFLIGSRLFVPYVLGSAALSVAYASRVGLIIVAMVVVAQVAVVLLRGGPGASRRWIVAGGIALVAVVGVALAGRVDGAAYIAQRFQSIGDDPGSVGRFVLWQGGLDVFSAHPLGVGQGNVVPMIEQALGAHLTEDNLHNQFLQHLVETGVQGLAAYLLLTIMAWRRVLASRFRDPMALYVGMYFVLSSLQFRGAEALMWFIYGIQGGVSAAEGIQGGVSVAERGGSDVV